MPAHPGFARRQAHRASTAGSTLALNSPVKSACAALQQRHDTCRQLKECQDALVHIASNAGLHDVLNSIVAAVRLQCGQAFVWC